MGNKISYDDVIKEYASDVLDEDSYRRLKAIEHEQAEAQKNISREAVGKIAMQGYIWIKENNGRIWRKLISMVNKDYVMVVKYYDEEVDNWYGELELFDVVDRYWWKDYGKTFAATKEELEAGKE